LAKDEFVVARLEMICCAADVQVTGLICDYNKVSELNDDSWITTFGTMDTENHDYGEENQLMSVIKGEKIEPAANFKISYIYPKQ
jgi:putative membrane protein